MQHPVRKRYIRSRLQLQMKIALPSRWSLAGINDDPTPSGIALLPEKFIEDWKSLSAIRSSDKQNLGEWNVVPGIRSAIYTECFIVSRRGGDHAKASVVINIACAQTSAGEFAHQIGFLSCERRTRVDANRILAVRGLEFLASRD